MVMIMIIRITAIIVRPSASRRESTVVVIDASATGLLMTAMTISIPLSSRVSLFV